MATSSTASSTSPNGSPIWAPGPTTRALQLNEVLHRVRHALGLPYWSLSAWLKHAVKDAVEYVCRFEDAVAQAAAAARPRRRRLRPHPPGRRSAQIGDVLYLNDGDWVESCTALVEDARGHLEIVRWAAPLSTPAYSGASAAAKPRLYPRRIRRVTAGGVMPAGRFPVPGQEHLKVLIVTDAWRPQVNGVVTTLEMLGRELRALGHEVRYATPQGRFTAAAADLSRNPPRASSRARAWRR